MWQAALFCADRLHHALAEEISGAFSVGSSGFTDSSRDLQWRKAMSACFLRMDAEVGGACRRGGLCDKVDAGLKCCPEPSAPETVGSTAVIAVVDSCQIIVANCGDSRAVLSRGGLALALSNDHKVSHLISS
jgi:protein phosphatase 2C